DSVNNGFRKTADQVDTTGRSFYEVTHLTRIMSEQLLGSLSPALGEAASGANLAARGFQGMSAGLTIAATGAALAVSILAIMIRTMNEMAVSQAKISIGFKTMNLEGLKSGLLQATTDIEVFTQRSQFLLGRFVNSVSLLMQK